MNHIPPFGLGTFRLKDRVVIDSVRNGLDLGYRAIDTAQIYGNEAEVGQAIAESGVSRGDLFLTTKIWVDNYAREKLAPSLEQSLARLRTDYVDLTLIHWPAPNNGVPLEEFMHALVEARARGLTRRIGISNFNIALTKQAIAAVGMPPTTQVLGSCTSTGRRRRWNCCAPLVPSLPMPVNMTATGWRATIAAVSNSRSAQGWTRDA